MLKYLPSTICASASTSRSRPWGSTPWTPELQQHALLQGGRPHAVRARHQRAAQEGAANNLQAVRKKYAQEKHGNVSSIAPAHLGL